MAAVPTPSQPGDDLIDFSIIETHKENIQSLPSGRSAKALANLFSPHSSSDRDATVSSLLSTPNPSHTQNLNDAIRTEYERELHHSLPDSDDPLDIYDRYIKWVLSAYPSASNTAASGLLPLLERATKAFLTNPTYKNDPRYLKIWLHYIRLFSDAPGEIYRYLARHSIGESLALFYESFAEWCETQGRWKQAEEVFMLGIEKQARPAERLGRKFEEFRVRREAKGEADEGPQSPVISTVRPALAAKMDPFAPPATEPVDPQARPRQGGVGGASSRSGGKQKMSIFSDTDGAPSGGAAAVGGAKGWESIGNLAERKKENTVEAKLWAGETLKGGKRNAGAGKMMIFRDTSIEQNPFVPQPWHETQKTVNPKTGRHEVVFVNLEKVYPDPEDPSVEYSFEELRAISRGLYDMVGIKRRQEEEAHLHKPVEPTTSSPPKRAKKAIEVFKEPEPVDEQIAQPNLPKVKKRAFEIHQETPAPNPEPLQPQTILDLEPSEETVCLHPSKPQTVPLNDAPLSPQLDENGQPLQSEDPIALARRLRKEEKANRTRKIRVMEVKAPAQTIQTNLDSPTGPKTVRRKKSGKEEPTMTINTREAMDDIYEIFNQPLKSTSKAKEEEKSEYGSDDDDDDYTSAGDSTTRTNVSGATSEYETEAEAEDEDNETKRTVADAETESTGWSGFTASKHVPQSGDEMEDVQAERTEASATGFEIYEDRQDELTTPVTENEPSTKYINMPPDGIEIPLHRYRDPAQVANNRLPFMTPIVERTESSLGAATALRSKDYFSSKTPSKGLGVEIYVDEDGSEEDLLGLSPVEGVIDAIALRQETKVKAEVTVLQERGILKERALVEVSHEIKAERTGPIILDAQCNPMSAEVHKVILGNIQPPLTTYPGYFDHSSETSAREAEIRRYTRNAAKGSPSKRSPKKSKPLNLQLADTTYSVRRELGKGAYAPVYLVENLTPTSDPDNDDSDISFEQSAPRLEALKLETDPPNAWEFYILRQCASCLSDTRDAKSIVEAYALHLYRDEHYLTLEYRSQGTLLDLINLSRAEISMGLEEPLAIFFTIELFRVVESLHACGIIHGDLKADNVLIRFDALDMDETWSSTYRRDGAYGWARKGVCLIDFGRGIDMKAFRDDVQFVADWKAEENDCHEMREMRPWTYQVDYYGLAGTVHSILFGKYMETVVEKKGTEEGLGREGRRYRVKEGFKRYWQSELWGKVFELLLNPGMAVEREEEGRLPVLRGMREVREEMEEWLERNCEKGVGLKALIRKMEAVVKKR